MDLYAGGVLWRNNGGTNFAQIVAMDYGIFGDYDHDGYLDIFVWPNSLYRNNQGMGFDGVTMPTLPFSVSRGIYYKGNGYVERCCIDLAME